MSVPKYKRKESGVKFMDTFHSIRRECIQLIIRDFGMRPKGYSIAHITDHLYRMDYNDAMLFKSLMERYNIDDLEIDINGKWLIEYWKMETMNTLTRISISLQQANAIYLTPSTDKTEYVERLKCWSSAIGHCNSLKDRLTEVIEFSPVSAGPFKSIARLLDTEVSLIKGVRKSDRERWRNIIIERNKKRR